MNDQINIKAKFEQSTVPLRADMKFGDPVTEMIIEDDEQLKKPGDCRVMRQNGTIISPDGETTIPVELTFVRNRNDKGGVDVTCCVPSLGLAGTEG